MGVSGTVERSGCVGEAPAVWSYTFDLEYKD